MIHPVLAVLLLVGQLWAAPLQGNTAGEEMQLANLIKQAQASKSQVPNDNLDHTAHTKVLLQKTKIVIPIEDKKPPVTAAPVAAEPVEPMEPMQFVAPPEQILDQAPMQEEDQFLMPADYELPTQPEQQYQTYDEEADLDLTPRAVAEYLILTGDFKGFDEALTDLLEAGMLTLSQIEQYRFIVGEEYERLMANMVAAEADYTRQQQLEQEQLMRPTEIDLSEQLSNDAEAGELLQALLQDYMNTEAMDANTQEYEDFLDWMEKSLQENQNVPEQEQRQELVDATQQRLNQQDMKDLVENELESLPALEESSGDLEQAEDIIAPSLLSSSQKKLKKAVEADH